MRIYLSHKITGGGAVSSYAELEKNCKEAVLVADTICTSIPSIEMYVPGGQSEQFVHLAYVKGYLTIEQILDVDCMIIDGCDLVLVYVPKGDELQGGRKVECDYAEENNIPVVVFENFKDAVEKLKPYVAKWAEFKGE